jgi:iron complex outermembrane receptor protein
MNMVLAAGRIVALTRLALLPSIVLICTVSPARAQAAPPPPAEPPTPQFTDMVEVVGATPIHGVGIARSKIPSNVQVATAEDLSRSGGIHAGEQLASSAASIHVNDAQANPFQPDVQFRGFTASPLLGLPQGVAIYQDGVRMNEPFGDTVNWDALPVNAIASVNVMPGSNPLFGLNALGGAVSLQTKTGFSHPGHAISAYGGSFGRRWIDLQTAGRGNRLGYFVTGRVLNEDGWRDFSPSRVNQVFGNLEWRRPSTMVNVSVGAAVNRLTGNGPAPVQLLDEDRAAIFTHPDETNTDMALVTLRGRHAVSPRVSVDAVLFFRPATIRTLNGDDTAYDECEDVDGLLCEDEGEGDPVVDQFGRLVAVDEDDPFDATNNTSKTRTRGWGASLQGTVIGSLAGRDNHLVTGVSIDGAGSRYESDTELARLTGDRGTAGTGIFDAGASVRLLSDVRNVGIYAANFWSLSPRLTLMGAARFTHSAVDLRDQVDDDLTGTHAFSRVDPSVGMTFELGRGAAAFGSFGTASRVPAPSELSCADPEDPCRLPNAFVADPPLDPVVARTWEGGARGRASGVSWTAAAFRTSNHDDLIFISSGALSNHGHFENVGDTVRRGLELMAAGAAGVVRWSAAYTFLRATFETPLRLASPNHPDAIDGEIAVQPGNAIPSVPRHNFKVDVSATAGRGAIGATIGAVSSQFLRGDEINRLSPVDGSAVLNMSGSYAMHRRVRVVARIANVFNAAYETFGLLGDADDVLGDDYDDPRYLSPGAPRAAWVGIELSLR